MPNPMGLTGDGSKLMTPLKISILTEDPPNAQFSLEGICTFTGRSGFIVETSKFDADALGLTGHYSTHIWTEGMPPVVCAHAEIEEAETSETTELVTWTCAMLR